MEKKETMKLYGEPVTEGAYWAEMKTIKDAYRAARAAIKDGE